MGVARPQPAVPATAEGSGINGADVTALLRILETAHKPEPDLAAFAIAQLRASVLAVKGPASSIRMRSVPSVNAETVALLRRILLAAGGEAGDPVGRAEAEALFDLHDAVASSSNDAAFDDLFFRAVVHHLLAQAGSPVPPRREFLSDEAPAPLSGGGEFSIRLGADEAAWLASRIMRDGKPTQAEYALLRFFSADRGGDDPALRRFLEPAA